MTTLITGGTGKTGLGLAKLLHAANHPVLIATRTGEAPAPFKAVKFDWFDASTHDAVLSAEPKVDRVYIVGPPASSDASVITKFVDLAISKGVKRFALLSATLVEPDANSPVPASVVHQQLLDAGVDYVVLRPTWFIRKFYLFILRFLFLFDYRLLHAYRELRFYGHHKIQHDFFSCTRGENTFCVGGGHRTSSIRGSNSGKKSEQGYLYRRT